MCAWVPSTTEVEDADDSTAGEAGVLWTKQDVLTLHSVTGRDERSVGGENLAVGLTSV